MTREINKAIGDMRKNKRRGNFDLKDNKYLFLKGNSTIIEYSQPDNLMDKYKSLGDASIKAQMDKKKSKRISKH